MVFDAEILKVAKLYVQKTYDIFDYLDGKISEDIKKLSDEIIATLEKKLTDEDRIKFKPIAQVILRDAVKNPLI